MAPPIKHENVPPLAECRDVIQRAVAIKMNVASSFKLTDKQALQLAGCELSVASTQAMITRFRRQYEVKRKEQQQQGEDPPPPPPPPSGAKKPTPKKALALQSVVPRMATAGTAFASTSAAGAGAAPPTTAPRQSPVKKSSSLPNRSPPPPQTAPATAAAASATAAGPTSKPPPPKRLFARNIYRTSKQVNAAFARKQIQRENDSHAMSVATQRYVSEQSKKKDDRMSAAKIVQNVNAEFGTNITARTLLRYVQNGFVGQGLKKEGRPAHVIPDDVYPILLDAYKTHMVLVPPKKSNKGTGTHLCAAVRDALQVDEKVAIGLIRSRLRRDSAEFFTAHVNRKRDEQPQAALDATNLNSSACDKLILLGYNGDALRVQKVSTATV